MADDNVRALDRLRMTLEHLGFDEKLNSSRLQHESQQSSSDQGHGRDDVEAKLGLYNQHKKGWPCKQIIPNGVNLIDCINERPMSVAPVLRSHFFGWAILQYDARFRPRNQVMVYDILTSNFYVFITTDDCILNMTITENLVGFVTSKMLYACTFEEMIEHAVSAGSGPEHDRVYLMPLEKMHCSSVNANLCMAGEKNRIAVLGNKAIYIYDLCTGQMSQIDIDIAWEDKLLPQGELSLRPASCGLIVEDGIWLIIGDSYKGNEARTLDIHHYSDKHQSWKLSYSDASQNQGKPLMIRPTGVRDCWHITTASRFGIILRLSKSDSSFIREVPEQSCVWKDKLYTGKQGRIVISQFKLASTRQTSELASIRWRTRQAWKGDAQEVFASEEYLIRLYTAPTGDPREDNVRLNAFIFDEAITSEKALPLTANEDSKPFYLTTPM